MTFVGDESVDLPVLEALQGLGLSVIVVGKVASGSTDPEVLELARRSDAIVITSDKGFGELVVRQGQRCRGVVLLRLPDLTPTQMAAKVVQEYQEHGQQWDGSFTVIRSRLTRIRPLGLPITDEP